MNSKAATFFFIGWLSIWPQFGGAATSSDGVAVSPAIVPDPIIVVGQKSGKVFTEKLGAEQLTRKWTHLKSTPPHRQLNADHHVIDYEGIELKSLIGSFDLSQARWIYAIGSDDYISMIPAELIRNHRSLLAFREDGKTLTKQRGGQQIVYPTESGDQPVAEPFAKKAAFWAWYVRALVVGSLPNSILWNEKREDISKSAAKAEPVHITPLPTFSYDKYKCPEVYAIPVDVPFMAMAHKADSSVRFLTLSGKTIDISAEDLKEGRYHLLAARGKVGVPIQCGGPFFLIKRDLGAAKSSQSAIPEVRDYVPLIYAIDGTGT